METALCNTATRVLAAPSLPYNHQGPATKGFARWRTPPVRSAQIRAGVGDKNVNANVNTNTNTKLDDASRLLLQVAFKPDTRNWLHFFFHHRPESRPSRNDRPDDEVAVSEPVSSTPNSHSRSPCLSCCEDGDGGGRGERDESERKLWKSPQFTAEKARILRTQLRASETWHDAMYHSSIASRLATTHPGTHYDDSSP